MIRIIQLVVVMTVATATPTTCCCCCCRLVVARFSCLFCAPARLVSFVILLFLARSSGGRQRRLRIILILVEHKGRPVDVVQWLAGVAEVALRVVELADVLVLVGDMSVLLLLLAGQCSVNGWLLGPLQVVVGLVKCLLVLLVQQVGLVQLRPHLVLVVEAPGVCVASRRSIVQVVGLLLVLLLAMIRLRVGQLGRRTCWR